MKEIIKIGFMLVLFTALFSACRKDNYHEIPVKPEEAIMTFGFSEPTMKTSGIMIKATPSELEGIFIDLGDGKFVPVSENGFYDHPEYISLTSPTKGKNVRIKGKVKEIELHYGNVAAMEVSQNKFLERLAVRNSTSTFQQVDVTKNPNLKEILIQSSNLAALDVSQNSKLTRLSVLSSALSNIVFPKENNLEELELQQSQLTQIDVSQCKKLRHLSIYKAPISSIELSQLTLLETLDLNKTNLTQLNLSAQPNLKVLTIYENKLNALVLPASFPKLYSVHCRINQLKNAQMEALANRLSTATEVGNNDLRFGCIDRKNPAEQNVISVAVVNKLKAKGWKVYDANGSEYFSGWLEYPGS